MMTDACARLGVVARRRECQIQTLGMARGQELAWHTVA